MIPNRPARLYVPVYFLIKLNVQGPIALAATTIAIANPLIAPKCFLPYSFGHVTMLSIPNSPPPIPKAITIKMVELDGPSSINDRDARRSEST